MSILLPRREFIAVLGGAAAWPLAVIAKQQTKPTIGWLQQRPGVPLREYFEAFRRGLAEIGFLEGRDVTVEYHTTDGHSERLSALAADLVLRRAAGAPTRDRPAGRAPPNRQANRSQQHLAWLRYCWACPWAPAARTRLRHRSRASRSHSPPECRAPTQAAV